MTRKMLILIFFFAHALTAGTSDGRISGYVTDNSTGEPLIFANVVLKGTDYGAATDIQGHFVIPGLPSGNYTLNVMMIGYRTGSINFTLSPGQDRRFSVALDIEAIETEAVTVTAERTRFEESVEISTVDLSLREIKAAPALVESDIFRSLQLMPGVQANNDFSSALVVRGGSPDENLILLDGIEVYNPYHLGGFFSTFNTDALANAEFTAGGFPARFGNRSSSVLQITTREGNSKGKTWFPRSGLGKFANITGIHGEVSLLSSKILAEGPLRNGSWMWSARRSYYDVMARLYYAAKGDPMDWKYYLWDSHGKIICNLNDKNRLTFTSYTGRDVLFFEIPEFDSQRGIIDMDWGNATRSLIWRSVPNSALTAFTSVAHTSYDWDFSLDFIRRDSTAGEIETNIRENIGISDDTFKHYVNWYPSANHTVTAGLQYKILSMTYEQRSGDLKLFDREQAPWIASLFIQDRWELSPLFRIQPGFRLTRYELHDHQWYLEPRIGFKYLLTENTSVKGSWGIYHQFLFTNATDEDIVNFVDVWLPVPKELKPKTAQHYILGIEQWIGRGFQASAEIYWKPYSNLLITNPANDPAVQDDDFIQGTGEARGLELLIRKKTGRVTGWVGYTWARLERTIDFNGDGDTDDNGEFYNPKYDRPHVLNGVLSWQASTRNLLGLTLSYSSGMPYTPVIGFVYTQSGFGDPLNPYANIRNVMGEINSERYPEYFRLDLSWSRKTRLFGADARLKFQVTNVTNHFNTLFYTWDHGKSPSEVTQYSMFPILPSAGIEFEL